jgi:hypothetical protein
VLENIGSADFRLSENEIKMINSLLSDIKIETKK